MIRVPTSTRRGIAGLGVVVAIAATGCSHDPPVTNAAYRRAANAVCRSTRTAITKFPEVDAGDPAALVKSGRRALVAQRAAARVLTGVRAPSRSTPTARRWLSLVRQALNSVDTSLRAQARGDLAAATIANAKGAALVTAADAAARSLGVMECVIPAG